MRSFLLLIIFVVEAHTAEKKLPTITVRPGESLTLREIAPGKWQPIIVPTPQAPVKTSMAGANPAPAPIAAGPAEGALTKSFKELNLDRPLSAAPAFVALGVSPETVVAPASVREFASSLINGVDRSGNLQTGVALETSLGYMLPTEWFLPDDYARDYWRRLLARTNISVATSKGSNDDKSLRMATGISLTLYDGADPGLKKWSQWLGERELDHFRRFPVQEDDPFGGGVISGGGFDEKVAAAEAEAIAKAFRRLTWGKPIWTAAWAPTWISESGKSQDLRYDGSTMWTTFGFGALTDAASRKSANYQILGHIRFREGEHVVDPSDKSKSADQDTLLIAARFRFGTPEFSGSVEGGYLKIFDGLTGDDDAWRIGGVLEKRLTENVWLVLSVGQDIGGAENTDNFYAIGSFRLGTADSPNFSP